MINSTWNKVRKSDEFIEAQESAKAKKAEAAPAAAEDPAGAEGSGEEFLAASSTSGQTRPPQQAQQSTTPNTPVGWGDSKPKYLPDMPENMPGPSEWEVTDEQTVAGQMQKNLAPDSPLLNQIRDQTLLQAGRAGMKNSLMALSAADKNAIDTAFSISVEDARTYARSAEFNAVMKNQFSAAEQAFMHNAMLSDQNFKQARVLQKEQIDGALQQIAKQIQGSLTLADREQEHMVQRIGLQHAQAIEAMELNHTLDVERLGVVQNYQLESMDFDSTLQRERMADEQFYRLDAMGYGSDLEIERMAFQTESQMIMDDNRADIQAALMDRGFMQDLTKREQEYGMQRQLNFDSYIFQLLQSDLENVGQIGSSGAKPDQQSNAVRQSQARTQQIMDMLAARINIATSFHTSPSGPAASVGVLPSNGPDYAYYGSSGAGGP